MATAQIGTAIRTAAALVAACYILLAAVDRASARDDSVLQFFSSAFGGAGASSSQVTPSDATIDLPLQERPLTIRPRRRPRLAVAALPVKPAKVAILEDPTLRRGDAVMTAEGLRIFVGSNASPHRRNDFVALANSGGDISKTTEKILVNLNRRPGG